MRIRCALILILLPLVAVACQDQESPTLAPTAAWPTELAPGLGDSVQLPTATASPTTTPTPTPTMTPSPTPSPTPRPLEWVATAQAQEAAGEYEQAWQSYAHLLEAPGVEDEERQQALLRLGKLQLDLGYYTEAVGSLQTFLDQAGESADRPAATFWLARAKDGLGDRAGALEAYQDYLSLDDTLKAYVSDLIADAYLALGDSVAAIEAYETALLGTAPADKVISIRERLADAYMAAGNLDAAIAQYDAVGAVTDDADTLGRMDYLAGYALIMSGRVDEGIARYYHAIETYPSAYDSYLALVELVDAGYKVDDFTRGIVDYYAGACLPAINAFYRHFEADPLGHPADGHWYAAKCYVDMGENTAALAELQVLLDTHPNEPLWDDAWLEMARVQVLTGDTAGALETYLELADNYPQSSATPNALWRAAALKEQAEAWLEAHDLYRRLATDYPAGVDAAEALFRAGLMAYRAGESGMAAQNWAAVAADYSSSDWAAPSLIWVLRTLPAEEAADYQTQAAALPQTSYYAIRASDLVSDVVPFQPPEQITWPTSPDEGRPEAEEWLQEWLGSEIDLATLTPAIAADPRWERGRKLWQLGLTAEALLELNGLRADLATDALSSYQLALAFRDLGIYRSSILAANAVIWLSPADTPLDAPRFVARLAYPTYYLELIEQSAAEFGVDPLLVLAMIRQESLFESVARSWASAHGLMQVIPSTGEYIAGKLGVTGFESQDLYRPVVSVRFGSFYLAEQMDLFDNDPYAALSAYNAGPGNAGRWYDTAGGNPDLYLEIITLSEPRRYIQSIYTHYTYYRVLYGTPAGELDAP